MIEKVKSDYEIKHYIETSAKTGSNVVETFVLAAQILYANTKMLKSNDASLKRTFSSNTFDQITSLKNLKKKSSCCG